MMNDTPHSAAAAIAANAKAALARLDEDGTSLRATLDQYTAEISALQSEQRGLWTKREELVASVEANRVELKRAQLEQEVSVGTTREQEADAHVAALSATLDTAWARLHEHDQVIAVRDAEISSRLDYLQHVLADSTKMLAEQQAKRAELLALYEKRHAEHGAETYRALLAEEKALEKSLSSERKRYETARAKLAAFRATVGDRLAEWPALSAEVVVQHGAIPDDALSGLLCATSRYYAEIEPLLVALPWDPLHLDITIDGIPLWAQLTMRASDMRMLYDLLHKQTTERQYRESYQIASLATRRVQLDTLAARVQRLARHTTQSEEKRIAAHLAELATVEA